MLSNLRKRILNWLMAGTSLELPMDQLEEEQEALREYVSSPREGDVMSSDRKSAISRYSSGISACA